METLRALTRWIGRHKITSVLLLVAFASFLFYIQMLYQQSQGQLTLPLQKGRIAETVYGIGTVVANQSFQIRPGQVSHIDRYFCREGDVVHKGANLLLLDGVLWKAPFDGTVTSLPFKIGENVYAQGPILTLTNLSDRYMTVSLEQQGALRVQPGQKVKMNFESIRDQSFDGTVQAVYSNDNNFLARIDVSNLPPHILPGMTADVAIILRTRDDVLLIPVAAMTDHFVWVKRGRKIPKLTSIETGIVDRDFAELKTGDVSEGDRLLIKGAGPK